MNATAVILDHHLEIKLDPADAPFSNYQAFKSSYVGLKILADSVRELEIRYVRRDPHAAGVVFHMSSQVPDLVPCAFNWFSVTLVNYLRLVALVDLMNRKNWKSPALADPQNRTEIREHCTAYVKAATPEVYVWRNKVAAHFAATDPFRDDNLGTLEQSIMNPVIYRYPHYYVGLGKLVSSGQVSELPMWALTKVYENLRERYWPEMTLRPVA